MTSVVGILNKRGIAIAADSAVTRTHGSGDDGREKVTNNGNKMVRMCESSPICVMVTGTNDFLGVPWDIIIRRYRTARGKTLHHSMEDAVHDFFSYISGADELWDDFSVRNSMALALQDIYEDVADGVGSLKGSIMPEDFDDVLDEISEELDDISYDHLGECHPYIDYSIERFSACAETVVDDFIQKRDSAYARANIGLPGTIWEELREQIYGAIFSRYQYKYELDNTELIFCGYDIDSPYPSLVPVSINRTGGVDRHISYRIDEKNIVRIDDQHPAAICPFAQTDVMDSLLSDADNSNTMEDSYKSWSQTVQAGMSGIFNLYENCGYFPIDGNDITDKKIRQDIKEIDTKSIKRQFDSNLNSFFAQNKKEWERMLEDYDLKSMADLAESLIELTEFNRVLTFKQEGVGGTIDLATISRSDGFSWLNRKSWYHKKDTDGMHGKFGI